MVLSSGQRHVMTYVYAITSSVSMLGSALIVASFFAVAGVRKRPLMVMVFWMACADFMLSFKYFLPAVAGALDGEDYAAGKHWCAFEGAFSQFFGTASVSWYFAIAINTFSALTNPLHFHRRNWLPLYHIYVWGLSGFSTILIWLSYGWEPSGDGTCWLDDTAWRLFFYVPLFVYIVFACVLLGYIVYFRRVLSLGNPNHLVARMLAFVLIFIVTWLWVSFQRFWEFFRPSESPEYLLIPHCIAISGQGFGNFCCWISSPAFGLRVPCCSEQSLSSKLSTFGSSTPGAGHEDSDNPSDSNGSDPAAGSVSQSADASRVIGISTGVPTPRTEGSALLDPLTQHDVI